MSHSNEPPGLPEIVDEAGDSPVWLPILGVCLLGALLLVLAVGRATGGDDEQTEEGAPAAEEATVEAEAADEAPADEPEEAPAEGG